MSLRIFHKFPDAGGCRSRDYTLRPTAMVGPKVRSGLSGTSYGKTLMNFLASPIL